MSKRYRRARAGELSREKLQLEEDAAFQAWEAGSRRERGLAAAAVGALTLIVYALTLCPTVPGGDSGMFIQVASTGGVAHPPGYPLYTMLGHLFSLLPWGSVAWRVNLLSAACGTLAAVLLTLAVSRWARNAWAGALSGGLFAFAPLVWRYAVVAEVFALNHVFVAALLYLLVRYEERRELRFARWGALVTGLGLSNHHTLLFIAVPFTLRVLWLGRATLLRPRVFVGLAGLFALGFLPYLYLPLASARVPLVSWGDQTTLAGFLEHFFRREYGTFRLAPGTQQQSLWKALWLYGSRLPADLAYAGFALAIVGVAQGVRRGWLSGLTRLTLGTYVFYVVVFHSLSIIDLGDLYAVTCVLVRFWLQADLLVCAWAGLGLAWLLRQSTPEKQRWLGPAATLAVVAVVGGQLTLHYRAEDQSRNWTFHHYGSVILKNAPPNALLLTQGDIFVNVIRYLQQSEGLRPDITHLDLELLKAPWIPRINAKHFGDVSFPGLYYGVRTRLTYGRADKPGYTFRQLVEANIGKRPVLVPLGDFEIEGADFAQEFTLEPFGFMRTVERRSAPVPATELLRRREVAMAGFEPGRFQPGPPGSWEMIVQNEVARVDEKLGVALATAAVANPRDAEGLRRAIGYIEAQVARLAGANAPVPGFLYKNLGVLYWKLSELEPAARARMRENWEKFLAIPESARDPEAPSIRKLLETAPR